MNNSELYALDEALDYLNEGLFNKNKKKPVHKQEKQLSESERKALYDNAIKCAKETLSEFKKHSEFKDYFKCYTILDKEDADDNKEEFINGDCKDIYLISYDLWDVQGGQARKRFEEDECKEAFDFIMKSLDSKLEKFGLKANYGDDWDTGTIDCHIK